MFQFDRSIRTFDLFKIRNERIKDILTINETENQTFGDRFVVCASKSVWSYLTYEYITPCGLPRNGINNTRRARIIFEAASSKCQNTAKYIQKQGN